MAADVADGDPDPAVRRAGSSRSSRPRSARPGADVPPISNPGQDGGAAGKSFCWISRAIRNRELHALLLGPAPLLGEPMLHLPALALAELLGLPPDLLCRPVQVDEDPDLRAEHLGHDRLEQEVDRPDRVAPEHLHVGALVGGQEDDRGVSRAVALADQVGDLEAVHARHLDVHQDQRRSRRRGAGAAPRRPSRPGRGSGPGPRGSPPGRGGCWACRRPGGC